MARIDLELVKAGFFPSRAKATAAIADGIVFCDGTRVSKPGHSVRDGQKIEIQGIVMPYVSRGGLKLEAAIKAFGIDLGGKIVLDVGSSTGGFTDCALRHGAAKVIAVDVGSRQMDETMRLDKRVTLHETLDFRDIPDRLVKGCETAVMDVSFISATMLAPRLARIASLKSVVCLIKPQFECGPVIVKKGRGVVKSAKDRQAAVDKVTAAFAVLGFGPLGIITSPITGGSGNVEFLAWFTRG